MQEVSRLLFKVLELEKSEQVRLIELARKDACKKQGGLAFWAKWGFVHVSALAVAAFLAGFGLTAFFHILRSDAPSSTTIVVLLGVGFAVLWPSAQRVVSVCLLRPEIATRLDQNPI